MESSERMFSLKIARQDRPGSGRYWETFRVRYLPQMNITSALQEVAAHPVTVEGAKSTPVVYDAACLEEVCGSCTMLINGRVRQACTALVDQLLRDNGDEITIEPMTKFPVMRDLSVDRSRMFHELRRIKGWVPVDGYHYAGAGPRISPGDQEEMYPVSRCMTCGCCVEACPQYSKIELHRYESESDEDYARRQKEAFDKGFIGPTAISLAVRFNTHPIGAMNAGERLDALMQTGGISDCGNAQNCVKVCPKDIPLTRSIARAGRATTLHAIKRIFMK